MLELVLSEYNPNFVCLSEHWQCKEKLYSTYLNEYSLVSDYCRKDHAHGGTAIFVRNHILNLCKSIKYLNDLSIEMCIECSAVAYNNNFCILNIYRPPSGNLESFFMQLSKLLTKSLLDFKFLIICGDLNINNNNNTMQSKVLSDIFTSLNLTSLIFEPTRIAKSKSGLTQTIIDYVVSSDPNYTKYINFDPGLSDHHCQIIYCNPSSNVPRNLSSKNYPSSIQYKKINDQSINHFKFLFQSFSLLKNTKDIDIIFDDFFEHFLWCFNTACNSRRYVGSKPVPEKIQFSLKLKNDLIELEKLSWLKKNLQDENIINKYNEFKKQIQKDIKKEKMAHYDNIVNNSNNKTKTVWNLVNQITHKSSNHNKTNISLNYENTIINNPLDIANIFGDYLAKVINNKITNHFGNNISQNCTSPIFIDSTMFFYPVSSNEIEKIINNLPNKKSTGLDEIPVTLIKQCSRELSQILADIINLSITTGQFPNSLKNAAIIPVFKKGDPHNIDNYRPISLLSIFSKIFEKLVYNRILNFLNVHNVLTDSQHGFRPGFSTESSSVELIQHIHNEMDKKHQVVAVLFDLTRAFDTVDKIFVCNKISNMGLRGPINKWVESFLSNRKIIVKISEVQSDIQDINIGTPQGSVLGPLIFLLFVNDLPDHITQGKVFMYADDTTIVLSDETPLGIELKVNKLLLEFSDWCQKNRLIINYEKTLCIEFLNKHRVTQNNFNFLFNNHTVKTDNSAVFLGITLDTHLVWDQHIEKVATKLNKSLYVITSLKNCLNTSALINIYYCFVYSAIAYNIIVWGQSKDISRIFILQKRIIRLIFNLDFRQSCREIFKTYNILTVASIYLMKLLVYIHINKNKFLHNGDTHSYPTRGRNLISLRKHDHEIYKKSPIYSGCRIYNYLPEEIKNCTSQYSFKNKLKKLLTSSSFYSVNEFTSFLQNRVI